MNISGPCGNGEASFAKKWWAPRDGKDELGCASGTAQPMNRLSIHTDLGHDF